jgi:uncharacterized membrane protein
MVEPVGAHQHGHSGWQAPRHIERTLWVAVGAWALLALIGLALLWPGGSRGSAADFEADARVTGTVDNITIVPCTGTAVEDLIDCRLVSVRLQEGPRSGSDVTFEQAVTSGPIRVPEVGDGVVLSEFAAGDGTFSYNFADYERTGSMLVLGVFFVAAVLLLGRWRGLGALVGLGVSIVVLVAFMLPALLDGSNPIVVAIVGASIIAFASLYLAHGVTAATNVALLSTLLALALTGILAWIFIGATTFTGLTDESSFYLEALGVSIDPRGLLLAGVVIGALGVLDDVTVTQVSAVAELRALQPDASPAVLYRSALTIGRDHISSTVNTLFLAYAGAALPLLLVFRVVQAPIGDVAMREQVAVEIVRTLVGSMGLVAAVPIATGLATLVLTRSDGADHGAGHAHAVGDAHVAGSAHDEAYS